MSDLEKLKELILEIEENQTKWNLEQEIKHKEFYKIFFLLFYYLFLLRLS